SSRFPRAPLTTLIPGVPPNAQAPVRGGQFVRSAPVKRALWRIGTANRRGRQCSRTGRVMMDNNSWRKRETVLARGTHDVDQPPVIELEALGEEIRRVVAQRRAVDGDRLTHGDVRVLDAHADEHVAR